MITINKNTIKTTFKHEEIEQSVIIYVKKKAVMFIAQFTVYVYPW